MNCPMSFICASAISGPGLDSAAAIAGEGQKRGDDRRGYHVSDMRCCGKGFQQRLRQR